MTTTSNTFTDHGPTTGMGFPPPGSGALNSKQTEGPTKPGDAGNNR